MDRLLGAGCAELAVARPARHRPENGAYRLTLTEPHQTDLITTTLKPLA
ncbi:hypothetical protein [Actinomadura nitritigenes]